MMKRILLLPFCLISVAAVQAQHSGNSEYNTTTPPFAREAITHAAPLNDHEMTVTINGLLNVAADEYVAVFNVIQIGATAAETDNLMQARIKSFTQALRRLGIDTTSISTDMVSFVPRYDLRALDKLFSRSYNEVPDGFELQKSIHIRYQHRDMLNRIVTAAAATAEIYDLVKVDYFLKDAAHHAEMLREKCIAALQSKLKAYVLLGMKTDTLKRNISEDAEVTYPLSRYASYQAVSRPSLEAIKKSVSSAPRNGASKYYSPVASDHYDVVINANIEEPVVQFSYSITIKYFLEAPEKPTSYLLVAPVGDVRALPR